MARRDRGLAFETAVVVPTTPHLRDERGKGGIHEASEPVHDACRSSACSPLVASACSQRATSTDRDGGGTASSGATVDCSADRVRLRRGRRWRSDPARVVARDLRGRRVPGDRQQPRRSQLAIDNLDGTLDATDGQLLGHDVTLQQEDDLCSAEGGSAGATALAANPDIVAVIGTSCSSAALGVADTILGDKGILLFSPSNTNPGLTSEEAHQPFYARTAHNDKIQGAIVAAVRLQRARPQDGRDDQRREPVRRRPGRGVPRPTSRRSVARSPVSEQVNSGDTDLGPVFTSIAAGKPDVVYGPNFNPVCALSYTQGADILAKGTIQIGSDGCLESSFIDTVGEPIAGSRLLRVVAGRHRVPGGRVLQRRRTSRPTRSSSGSPTVGLQRARVRRDERPVRLRSRPWRSTTGAGTSRSPGPP